MNTTFSEILEMRRKLDKALMEKTGLDELACGFDVEADSFNHDQIAFKLAYHHEISNDCKVSGEYMPTPQEAFESAMEAIEAVDYRKSTKEDKIKSLRDQIAKLEAEQ